MITKHNEDNYDFWLSNNSIIQIFISNGFHVHLLIITKFIIYSLFLMACAFTSLAYASIDHHAIELKFLQPSCRNSYSHPVGIHSHPIGIKTAFLYEFLQPSCRNSYSHPRGIPTAILPI